MFGLPKHGNGIGFHRLLAFCDDERIDLEAIGSSSIVITGSNGKGSTARFLYHCLRTTHHRVGCFTSPHLLSVNERFEIAGVRIDDATLNAYARRILAFNDRLQRDGDFLGAFELLFLVAVSWFRDLGVTCAVWEAGIGGRYDPIRVLRSPISALTSVDMEHTDLLGSTRQLVAFDKLDATRPYGRTFVSPAVGQRLEQDLEAFARVTNRSLVFVSREAKIADIGCDRENMHYTMSVPSAQGRIAVTIPLLGIHQVHNSATAIHIANAYVSGRESPFDLSSALQAIKGVRWPGRLEKIREEPETWIDVGHTPEAISRVCDSLTNMFDPDEILVVFGVSADKAIDDIASIVRKHFRRVILTAAYKNGLEACRLADYFDPSQIVGVAERIEDAVELSQSIAAAARLRIAVLGGLFLAVEFAHAVRKEDPRMLKFF